MAQFKYMNELTSMLMLDGPITKGPMPRWQKKALEQSNSSLNSTKNITMSTSLNKSPSRLNAGSDILKRRSPNTKTPSKSKSPSRSKGTTPNKGGKTPIHAGDRFIPSRSATNFDLAHYKITHDVEVESPTQKEMQRVMCENIQGLDINKQRVLSFQKKAACAPDGFQNPMKVLYSQVSTPASVKNTSRYIPQAPDRILDAPDIVDDYYLNLMDWSNNNILAAALGPTIYLWNAGTGGIDCLLQMEGNDYVCSVAWVQEGDYLAVGTVNGTVELWDCSQSKRLRIMDGHSGRVGALAWNNYVLTSGSRTGQILHHDVRQRDHIITSITGVHTEEVCGLKWSPDGRFLASGGNDNVLNVFASVSGACHTNSTPLYTFTAHLAAVKALAWCPWQPHVLASGGGTADRHIRFWNCNNGSMINAVDTKSQVCALLWSINYKELVSGHGFANNQLVIWKYPAMTRVAELMGHTARVLHLAMAPDGSTVMSAGADETLRLWKCFTKDVSKKKKEGTTKAKQGILNKQFIR